MQRQADIGEGAEEQEALGEHGEQHGARPGAADQAQIGHGELRRPGREPQDRRRQRAGAQLAPEQQPGDQEHAGQDQEHGAPAEMIADDAADDLAADQAHDLAGDEPGERRLALLVGDMVADEGHGERDDRRGGDAADQAQGGEHGERMGEGRRTGGPGGEQAGECDHPVLAVPVADRTPEQLADAVGQREGGDGEPDGPRRGRKLAGDRRHQRVQRRAPWRPRRRPPWPGA